MFKLWNGYGPYTKDSWFLVMIPLDVRKLSKSYLPEFILNFGCDSFIIDETPLHSAEAYRESWVWD